MAGTAAANPTPPFTECPAVGFDTSCEYLIVINSNGTFQSFKDPSQPAYDHVDDTLIGVLNESRKAVPSIPLTGSDIFGFDEDGLCSGVNTTGEPGFAPPPAGCPFGPTGYEGPGTSFTFSNEDEGSVNFIPEGLPAGQSTYFSLESAINELTCGPNGCTSGNGEECTLAKGEGHYGTPGKEGLNEDNNLGTPGKPHEFDIALPGAGGHEGSIRLASLTSAKCTKSESESEFSGSGAARFNGASGYTLSFVLKKTGGRIFLTLLLEKEGAVVYSLNEAELKKNAVELIS